MVTELYDRPIILESIVELVIATVYIPNIWVIPNLVHTLVEETKKKRKERKRKRKRKEK